MQFLERAGRALMGEVRELLAALHERRLALVLGILAALLLLAAQAPLRYSIQVGREDGPGSDLPLLDGFYPPERGTYGLFRWTSAHALIRLPGVGQHALQMTLRVLPIGPEVVQRGPRAIELWDGGRLAQQLPVRPQGAVYHLLLPPPDASGDRIVELRSATFIPTGDERSIGSPLAAVYIAGAGGPALPAWRSTLGWLGAAALAWLAFRRAGFGSPAALRLLLPWLLLAGLAALRDPPRFAFGTATALVALALGLVLTVVLHAAVPRLNDRFGVPLDNHALRWLLLLALLVFVLRYGGKIYPESMSGDIGFHSNRYDLLVRGGVLQFSIHRGVSFPYPSAFYVLLAPFSLLGLSQRVLLQLGAALLDAISPFLVYAIATRACEGRVRRGGAGGGSALPLLAAAIYALSPAGFMTTWWNFSTHIFAQFANLLLLTALVLLWPPTTNDQRPTTDDQRPTTNDGPLTRSSDTRRSILHPLSSILGLVVLQSLVYLGHFGFWMNMSLLAGIGVAVLLVAALRGRVSWRVFRLGLLAVGAAELLVALLFYSAYTGMFLGEIQATATSGLTGLAGRAPVDRGILWNTLWDAGFRIHFGFFPLPLALGGLLLLRPRTENHRTTEPQNHRTTEPQNHRTTEPRTENREPRAEDPGVAVLLVLMAGTFVIGCLFAVLPFVSGSSLATRWLMFSAWAVAVGAALSARRLWHSGYAARLVVLVMGCYVVWITASMWLMALAWRVQPPEPF